MRGRRSRIPIVAATICAVMTLVSAPAGTAAKVVDPTFAKPMNYGVGIDPSYVTAADLNSDSKTDLVVSNQESDDVSVLRNKGNGTFKRTVDYGVGRYPGSVFAADLNGDQNADLVAADFSDAAIRGSPANPLGQLIVTSTLWIARFACLH